MRSERWILKLSCCGICCLFSVASCSLLLTTAGTASAKPQRIVSLNLCVDQILIDLVAKERIAALSFLATDRTLSAIAERAAPYPRVRGSAEGVVALNPDLIIAGSYSTPATRDLLQRLGKRVVVVTQPSTIDGVRELVTRLANLVEAPQRGREINQAFDLRLQKAIANVPGANTSDSPRPTALAMQVNGIVSGPGTIVDDALRLAGLQNTARDLITERSGRVPLEMIVHQPPDVLVMANTPEDFRTVLADNLRHPALSALSKNRPVVALPMWATLCGTPYVATAVEQLIAARQAVNDQRGDQ